MTYKSSQQKDQTDHFHWEVEWSSWLERCKVGGTTTPSAHPPHALWSYVLVWRTRYDQFQRTAQSQMERHQQLYENREDHMTIMWLHHMIKLTMFCLLIAFHFDHIWFNSKCLIINTDFSGPVSHDSHMIINAALATPPFNIPILS